MPQPRDMPADRIGYLGIDLGTSGLKLALVGADGLVLAESEAAYDVTAPQPGWAETDPAAWVRALERAARSIARQLQELTLRGVGVTGQMHGTVLVDPAGRPVRSAVLWPDRRATAELGPGGRCHGTQRARLANPLVPGMTSRCWPGSRATSRSAWRPRQPCCCPRTTFAPSSPAMAAATLAIDTAAPIAAMPRARCCGTWSGTTGQRASAASSTWTCCRSLPGRLRGGCHAVAGRPGRRYARRARRGRLADTAATLVALAATQIGESAPLVVNLGTGAQILRPDAQVRARVDPPSHTYADAGRGSYVMVAVQNAGSPCRWVQRLLALSWLDFVGSAAAEDGSGDVSFVPFLTGERGGLAGPSSRAAWLGLDREHDALTAGQSRLRGHGVLGAAGCRAQRAAAAGTAAVERWGRTRAACPAADRRHAGRAGAPGGPAQRIRDRSSRARRPRDGAGTADPGRAGPHRATRVGRPGKGVRTLV